VRILVVDAWAVRCSTIANTRCSILLHVVAGQVCYRTIASRATLQVAQRFQEDGRLTFSVRLRATPCLPSRQMCTQFYSRPPPPPPYTHCPHQTSVAVCKTGQTLGMRLCQLVFVRRKHLVPLLTAMSPYRTLALPLRCRYHPYFARQTIAVATTTSRIRLGGKMRDTHAGKTDRRRRTCCYACTGHVSPSVTTTDS